jgi:hypothetical protein
MTGDARGGDEEPEPNVSVEAQVVRGLKPDPDYTILSERAKEGRRRRLMSRTEWISRGSCPSSASATGKTKTSLGNPLDSAMSPTQREAAPWIYRGTCFLLSPLCLIRGLSPFLRHRVAR